LGPGVSADAATVAPCKEGVGESMAFLSDNFSCQGHTQKANFTFLEKP
tara:strand:+ start:335 stop:478 length:144 start_codon:yes stop_codon:yes gene_type:complete